MSESENIQYTGNFYSMHKIPDGYRPISIALSHPRFYEGEELVCFMPTWDLVTRIKNGEIDESQYEMEYLSLLDSRIEDIKRVIADIRITKNVFLCHEPKGKFCHRHIVSKLLNGLDIKCSEL